ncbi:MAG: protein kinase, partial [Candidatus Aminicenantes bacterium]|nr:protein kinase [Candidatus Aminicenantes bacterium]
MKCLKCGCENPDDTRLCKSCGLELSGQDATEQISSGLERSYGDSDDLTFDDFIINKRFMIIKRLGKGGMGTIFHARDVKLKREVAIKCISEKTLEDFQSKARFLREAQTASQLEHPNICTIYEIYEEEKNN